MSGALPCKGTSPMSCSYQSVVGQSTRHGTVQTLQGWPPSSRPDASPSPPWYAGRHSSSSSKFSNLERWDGVSLQTPVTRAANLPSCLLRFRCGASRSIAALQGASGAAYSRLQPSTRAHKSVASLPIYSNRYHSWKLHFIIYSIYIACN